MRPRKPEEPAPPLLAENEPIVRAYYACNTQWRTGAMGRTGLLFVIAVPVELALGLLTALVLHRPGLGFCKTLTRLALILPMATTYAVVGLLGQVMLNQKYGVINQMLGWVGIDAINFIGEPTNAFIAVILWDIWQWTPFVALMLLAGALWHSSGCAGQGMDMNSELQKSRKIC